MNTNSLAYYSQSYLTAHNASVKPRTDFESVIERIGAKPIGLKSREFRIKWIYRFYAILNFVFSWIFMPKNRIIIFQYPFQIGIKQMFNRAVSRGNRTCLLVHDLDELRPVNHDPHTPLLMRADFLIVHTEAMAKWLREHHNISGKIIVLNLFDYLNPTKLKESENSRNLLKPFKVAFCGNLAKSEFLSELDIPPHIKFVVYGLNCPKELLHNPRVEYRGVASPDNLPDLISDCDFGLVWDGTSASCMKELQGTYLRYNAPHKVSLYLSAGLPVLIWNEMGIRDFILSNHVGLCSNSVPSLFSLLLNLDESQYQQLRRQSMIIGQELRNGEMYRKAIEKVCLSTTF